MLPITIGYIGGYETKSRLQAAVQSTWFSLGLATTLAGLGIIAALVGQVYGQVGIGLPIIVSIVAILMGLNLLEAFPVTILGGLGGQRFTKVRSYLIGLTFGVVASPVVHQSWQRCWLGCHNARPDFRWRFAPVLHWLRCAVNFGRYTASIKKVARVAPVVWLD